MSAFCLSISYFEAEGDARNEFSSKYIPPPYFPGYNVYPASEEALDTNVFYTTFQEESNNKSKLWMYCKPTTMAL